jgi:phage terminase Nu1 subunit (DNA packaging protein)
MVTETKGRARSDSAVRRAMTERYVTTAELADLMRVSKSTIKRLVVQGMPSETWGMKRTRRFLPSKAMEWARTRDMIPGDNSSGQVRQHRLRHPTIQEVP